MPISVVFDPPLPSDSPSTFNTKAFTLLGDLNDWSTQANALPGEVATNLSALLAAPPAIGSTTPAAGSFTTMSASGNTVLGDADTDTITPNAVLVNNIPLKWKSTWPFAAGSHGAWAVKGSDDHFYIDNFEGDTVFRRGSYAVTMTLSSAGAVTIPGSLSLTGGTFGYGVGAGGTVTQATSKSTAVTLNKPSGQITMNNAALAAGASVDFVVNNTPVAHTDSIILTGYWGVVASGNYRVETTYVGTGSFGVRVTNLTAGSLSEALQFNFSVIRGATS